MKEEPRKQKLTLGINSEVLEKAKAAGINISFVTEQILKAITYDPKLNTEYDLINAYEKFFDAVKPVLKRYGAQVNVGLMYEGDPNKDVWTFVIVLTNNGLRKDNYELEVSKLVTVSDVVESLYKPVEILEHLLKALIDAAEKNKEKMKEFEIALRFVKALSEGDKNKK